jgi:hypothetical protein
VKYIGDAAFSTKNLWSIKLDNSNLHYVVDEGILFDKAKTVLFQCPAGANNTTVTIPSTVKRIADYAFAHCNSLSSVKLPDGLKNIGRTAFMLCSSLSSISFPNGLEIIGEDAFVYCTSLESVTIPSGVIRPYAFIYCSNLTSVVILNNVSALGGFAFIHCPKLNTLQVEWNKPLRTNSLFWEQNDYERIKLIVPKGSKSLYQADNEWGKFKFIEEGNLTGIEPIVALADVYFSGNGLVVNSPVSETVWIYSMNGNLIHSTVKTEGEKSIHIEPVPGQLLIVRGSSGWVRKIVKDNNSFSRL